MLSEMCVIISSSIVFMCLSRLIYRSMSDVSRKAIPKKGNFRCVIMNTIFVSFVDD